MKYVKVIVYTILIYFLIRFTIFMATDYQTPAGRMHLPFVLWVIDTIDLFIHEAGHAVFALFGRMVHFLGGTLFQIIIPVAAVIVFGKSSPRSLPFTLYWTGHSIINSSIYISDAPYQQLPLISRNAIHDWHWIFSELGMIEDAEMIGAIVNIMGIGACVVGIGIGLYFLFIDTKLLFSKDAQSNSAQFWGDE